MKLIDADALIENMRFQDGINEDGVIYVRLADVRKSIEDAPEAVIRCKDCEHSVHWYGDRRRCFLWHEGGIGVFNDGFCNYPERRTDE